jgi:type I restriction enzyme, S subunit
VFGRKGAVDRCALVGPHEDGYFLGSDGIRLRLGEGIDPQFMICQLQSAAVRAWLIQNATGTTMASLNQQILGRVPVRVPSFAEQKYVGEAVADVNDLIKELKGLVVKKEAIKQGLMQELLTGRTRLPGFKGGWSTRALAACVGDLEAGVSVRSDPALTTPPYVLKTSALSRGRLIEGQVKSILAADIARARRTVRGGSMLVSRMNTPALVGEVAYAERDRPEIYLPDRVWQVRPAPDGVLDLRWLTLWLSTGAGSARVRDLATGTSGSMKNIPKRAFVSLDVPLPDPAEQRAIADVFIDADAELDALRAHLEKAKAIKEGMMQELLSGRTRLRVEAENEKEARAA